MLYAPGAIDETTVIPESNEFSEPLKINFSQLKAINSYGIRNFLKLIRAWEPKEFEYYDCPPVFVDTINVVKSLLGTPPVAGRIKSLAVPFVNPRTDEVYEILFSYDQIRAALDERELPVQKDPKSGEELEVDVDLDEYFLFLEED